MRLVVGLAGLLLVLWTLLSAVRTVVLPRSAPGFVSRFVFSATRKIFDVLAHERRAYDDRDQVMALYAPVALVLLPAVWLLLVSSGYVAMFWATGQFSVRQAFAVSGSSLLTLGFVPVESTVEYILAFTEATLGLGLVALLITFLPSIYSAFSRRETAVAMLEVRAGAPPSASEMLLRLHRIGWVDRLPALWDEWERWFTDLEESHTSYPALVFFRSPQPDRSWITAAGAVLDAAALSVSSLDLGNQSDAQLCLRAGFISLRRIAGFFGIQFDPDPSPTDPISLDRSEWDQVYQQLVDGGLPVKSDQEAAWADWAGWRVNYDAVLLALADLVIAPYAPWSSDRSADVKQRSIRWGRRRRD